MNESNDFLKSFEIPQILDDLGIYQGQSGLMVYDSAADRKQSAHNRPFQSEHFSVILVRKGSFRLGINLFSHQMKENDLVVIAPSFIRQITYEGPVEFYALLFSPQFLFSQGFYQRHLTLFPPFSEDFNAHLTLNTADMQFFAKLIGLLKESIEQMYSSDENYSITNLLFQSAIIQLGKYYHESTKNRISIQGNDLVYRFLTLLPDHFNTHRDVSFYAERLFVTPKYLTQVLSKNFGKSAKQYIGEMVIMHAKILLDTTNLSIGQIAEQLHFTNQFHFSRFFKKYTGMTPSDYRSVAI